MLMLITQQMSPGSNSDLHNKEQAYMQEKNVCLAINDGIDMSLCMVFFFTIW